MYFESGLRMHISHININRLELIIVLLFNKPNKHGTLLKGN